MGSNEKYATSRIRKELFRKAIHVFGFFIPFISIVAGVSFAAALIIALAAAYTVSEYFRLTGRNLPVLSTITKMAMRDSAGEERQSIFVTAPLYFAVGILASLLLFPAPFSYAAIAVVTLGDGFASIAAGFMGGTRFQTPAARPSKGALPALHARLPARRSLFLQLQR